jgi:hypothetical protein
VSGYTPVFDTVFTGTLHGKWPDTGLWLCLLAMADKHGRVDCTPQYIASVTGLTVSEVGECLARFMEPDPYSRTQTADGRRLELIDTARPWGWVIVNHGTYREKARKTAYDADRTESGADAARKRAAREVPTCPDVSRAVPLSDTDTDTDTGKNSVEEASTVPAKPNPVSEVFGYWQETMTSPHSRLSDKRARAIKARLRDGYTVEQLKRAVFGCSVTPHNMGFNERDQKYNDIELICRDAGHVDRFIANAARPPKLPEVRNG